MSENLPGTSLGHTRHEPPPVPSRHEPPPVPGSERELALKDRHEPPPVPISFETSAVFREEQEIAFVAEGSDAVEMGPPIPAKSRQARSLTIEIEPQADTDQLVVAVEPRPARKSSFLAWLALSLALVCLPPSIVAAVWFIAGFEAWPLVMICSLLAVCLGKFAKSRGGPSVNLATLAVQLGRGFFVIAIAGLILIVASVAVFGFATVQSVNQSWQQSNRIAQWVTDKVDAVEAFFTGQGHKAPALPSPSPAPDAPR